jgi:hypothetical protein
MSWEDDDFVPDVPVLDAPAEEDTGAVVDLALGGGSAPAPEARGPAEATMLKPKHLEKLKLKEREERAARERAAMAAAGGAEAALADPAAERKRVEALQRKADLALATEAISGAAGKAPTLEALVLQLVVTDGDAFKALGRLVAERVHELAGAKGTALAMRFYTEIIAVAGEKVGVDELKALETVVGVARNKKLTAEKGAKGGAKKKAGAKVHVGGDLDGAGALWRAARGERRPPYRRL